MLCVGLNQTIFNRIYTKPNITLPEIVSFLSMSRWVIFSIFSAKREIFVQLLFFNSFTLSDNECSIFKYT